MLSNFFYVLIAIKNVFYLFIFRYPLKLKELEDALFVYNTTAIPPGNLQLDPRGDPKHWNYVWTNFGDYEDVVVRTV